MSMDRLQEKIRRTKNPSVIDMTVDPGVIPETVSSQAQTWDEAYLQFAQQLLEAFRGLVPAVRFRFNSFAVRGVGGLSTLCKISQRAQKLGFYVLLDGPEALTGESAELTAQCLLDTQAQVYFDGLILSSYIGSDGLKPYTKRLKAGEKALFAVIRTPNKSASELQDLLTGSRLVHLAMADVVNHLPAPQAGRSGYLGLGCTASATSADSLRTLRSKYKAMFLLVDGYDYPAANAKNCSYAFDSLGHGAIVCAGSSVVGAWKDADRDPSAYVELAVEAAERMKKNLTKYVSVL